MIVHVLVIEKTNEFNELAGEISLFCKISQNIIGQPSNLSWNGHPPSWICCRHVWTTHEKHLLLLVFVVLHNFRLRWFSCFNNVPVLTFREFDVKMSVWTGKRNLLLSASSKPEEGRPQPAFIIHPPAVNNQVPAAGNGNKNKNDVTQSSAEDESYSVEGGIRPSKKGGI